MNASFLQALQAKSQKITETRKQAEIKPEAPKPAMISVVPAAISDVQDVMASIDYVINKERFDIGFSGAPSRDIRAELKGAGFWYDPDTTIWSHKDTEETRVFLNRVFDAGLEISPVQASVPSFGVMANTDDSDVQGDTSEEISKPSYLAEVTTEEFCTYRAQVDKLCRELNLDMGTLQLRAIEALYNLTFNN